MKRPCTHLQCTLGGLEPQSSTPGTQHRWPSHPVVLTIKAHRRSQLLRHLPGRTHKTVGSAELDVCSESPTNSGHPSERRGLCSAQGSTRAASGPVTSPGSLGSPLYCWMVCAARCSTSSAVSLDCNGNGRFDDGQRIVHVMARE